MTSCWLATTEVRQGKGLKSAKSRPEHVSVRRPPYSSLLHKRAKRGKGEGKILRGERGGKTQFPNHPLGS